MQQKILVIRFSSLGDVVLTSATLNNLRINFPDTEISFLTKESYAPLAKMIPGVDRVITLPASVGTLGYLKFLIDLDRNNFDLIVDLHNNFRSFLAGKIIGSPQKLIYPKRRRERVQIVKRRAELSPVSHTIDAYNSPLEAAGLKTPCKRPILSSISISERDAGQPTVLVAPGAAHATKRWPIELFDETAAKLHQRLNAKIVWAVSEAEAGLLDNVSLRERDEKRIGLSLDSLVRQLAESDVIVSNDSGVAHLGSAVNRPVIALFGPTHPALGFAPRGLFDKVIEVDEFCRPCSLHGKEPCFREEQFCFARIKPDDLVLAIEQTLGDSWPFTPAAFLDRDGTIIVDKDYLSDPDEIEFIPGAVEGMKRLQQVGYKLVIISNQSGVARGYFDLETVERVNGRLLERLQSEGVEVDGLYFCPHYNDGKVAPFNVTCDCRKPEVGMAETAALQLNLDLRRSVVIGDKLDDLNLGLAIGANPYLVKTGHGLKQMQKLPENLIASCVHDDLPAAVNHIINRSR